LAAEKELIVKENESDSNKLKNEISQLREELLKVVKKVMHISGQFNIINFLTV